ncbi:hypothetical protein GCM10027612_43110 [Microbispora bryophytorum subsp. camponoti]
MTIHHSSAARTKVTEAANATQHLRVIHMKRRPVLLGSHDLTIGSVLPSSSLLKCPGRARRVKGAYGVATRSAISFADP